MLSNSQSKCKMYRGTKGATEFTEIDEKMGDGEYWYYPEQVIDYMGIVGIARIIFPRVNGIGEKGAAN